MDMLLNKIYLKYLKKEKPRLQIFFGGASSGKSVFLAQRCVLDILGSKRNYLIVRKVARTIRSSVFNEITKIINENDLNNYFRINKSEMTVTCTLNKKQILFAGLDDPEKIKSVTPAEGVFTDIWIEEATELSREDLKQLDKRLRGQALVSKRITMSFNPILRDHWIREDFFPNDWDNNSKTYMTPDVSILKTTYRDNRFLAKDDIEALENETDEYYKDVYTEGNWGIIGEVIFKNWEIQDLSEQMKHFSTFKNGLDFGFGGHPSAMVHTHYDSSRNIIYVLDELYGREMTNDILAEEVMKIIDHDYVYCDSAEPKSIQELKNLGVRAMPTRKGKGSVNFGIQWLQRAKIIVHSTCQYMINELSKYQWKRDAQGNVLRVPVDKDNHLMDALRYAYEDVMIERKLQTMNKRKLGLY